MSKDLVNKYIWIVDTIRRYGRLTRAQLNALWEDSPVSEGRPLAERTFHHYRRAIEELFHIDIHCTTFGEYFIEERGSKADKALSDWLMDSHAVRSTISGSSDLAEKVLLEHVPSARQFLPIVLDAIRKRQKIKFSYRGFNRTRTEHNIIFSPYCVKLYRQRWYMLGLRDLGDDLRTYALDRIVNMELLYVYARQPENIDPISYFDDLIGVTSSKAEVKTIKLRVIPEQAKYLRALPLHESQHETILEFYSIFTLRVKINYELIHELLSFGSSVKVLEPIELKTMILNELRSTLLLYDE